MGTHSRAAKQAVVEETSEEANWRGSSQFWREKLKYADNWSSVNKNGHYTAHRAVVRSVSNY